MANTKTISEGVTVNLDESHEVASNGRANDARCALWTDGNREHVWIETNGDPVYGTDDVIEFLMSAAWGMNAEQARAIVEGDLSLKAVPPKFRLQT